MPLTQARRAFILRLLAFRNYGMRWHNRRLETMVCKDSQHKTLRLPLEPKWHCTVLFKPFLILVMKCYCQNHTGLVIRTIQLAGGVPVSVPVDESFKATTADLETKLTDKTVAFVLNSPENPTGVIYDQQELAALNEWTKQHDLMVITDDIYGQLVYNGASFTSIAQLGDKLDPRIIIISGGSKTYSMTGWRMGYVVADERLISKISAFLSHATGNPTAVSQYALLEAFTGDQTQTEVMRKAFEERLNTIYPLLNDIPGFELKVKPQGAFYLFPDVSEALKLSGIATAGELVSRLLAEAHVALVDGSAFGVKNHVRISYATDLDSLKTAMARIKAFMVQFKD